MPDISFSFIYTSYYKKAFSFAKSYVHDEAVAEDIASEALIALWEKTEITSVEEIAPLLFTILKHAQGARLAEARAGEDDSFRDVCRLAEPRAFPSHLEPRSVFARRYFFE